MQFVPCRLSCEWKWDIQKLRAQEIEGNNIYSEE